MLERLRSTLVLSFKSKHVCVLLNRASAVVLFSLIVFRAAMHAVLSFQIFSIFQL